jgi:hypothetical protein
VTKSVGIEFRSGRTRQLTPERQPGFSPIGVRGLRMTGIDSMGSIKSEMTKEYENSTELCRQAI